MEQKYSKAPMPSFVWINEGINCTTILDFLVQKFPRIEKHIWIERIKTGKVSFESGETVDLQTPCRPSSRLKYFREVTHEEPIPFHEKIIFENENFIIVDKPHFLPIHPAGKFVNETLVSRLKTKHNFPELAIAHRLDRLTAGLVLATKRKEVRANYQQLFMNRQISKTYLAVGPLPANKSKAWNLKNHLGPHLQHFRMKVEPHLPANSESYIELINEKDNLGLFKLKPTTGKKHQLRVHMTCIGSKVLNDPLYPNADVKENFSTPLQLLAYELAFTDPLSKEKHSFRSHQKLSALKV